MCERASSRAARRAHPPGRAGIANDQTAACSLPTQRAALNSAAPVISHQSSVISVPLSTLRQSFERSSVKATANESTERVQCMTLATQQLQRVRLAGT